MKYKIGDKVRVKKGLSVGKKYYMNGGSSSNTVVGSMLKYCGKVFEIGRNSYLQYELKGTDTWAWTDEMLEDVECDSIHIMEKDNKVIAVKKHGNTVINRAEARCHPEDEFDFECGAKLAFERLMKSSSPNEVSPSKQELNVGDTVSIIDSGFIYNYYIDWLIKYAEPGEMCRFSFGKNPGSNRGRISMKAPSLNKRDEMLYLIDLDNARTCIVSEKGIRKAKI